MSVPAVEAAVTGDVGGGQRELHRPRPSTEVVHYRVRIVGRQRLVVVVLGRASGDAHDVLVTIAEDVAQLVTQHAHLVEGGGQVLRADHQDAVGERVGGEEGGGDEVVHARVEARDEGHL